MGATMTASAGAPVSQGTGGGLVPFWYGSNIYARKFNSTTVTLTTTTSPQEFNIPPQGYLSAINLEVRSTGGSGGTMATDAPWNLFQSAEVDDVDGANIQYPMGGWSIFAGNMFYRPWDGDPATRYDYAKSPNPSFSLKLKPEIRHTAGVLANTDARSQYKLAYTVNTLANVITSSSTAPAVTISAYLEVWAQPDATDLQKNPIDPIPPGLSIQTKRRHQIGTLNSGSADNTMQLSLTGNEERGILMIIRDNNGARQDYLSDPINIMLDNKNLGVFSPNETFSLMNDFYEFLQTGTTVRPTGVYMWPRFYDPGRMVGQAWMGTTNATYLVVESASSSALSANGTWEIIVDEAIPVGPVDMSLESI